MGTKRIPFNLTAWLADKSQKVVTRDGCDVEILSTNMRLEFQPTCIILAKFDKNGFDKTMTYNCNGRAFGITDSDLDLFLVTEDEPLTEFEEELKEAYYWAKAVRIEDFVEEFAPKLLTIARKQIEKECWDKFQKATNSELDWLAAIPDSVKYDEGYKDGVKMGRYEVEKDLPKWKTNHECGSVAATANWLVKRNNGYGQPEYFTTNLVSRTDYFISIEDLEKLPKEE